MHSNEMEDIEAGLRGRHRGVVRRRLQLGRHVHRRHGRDVDDLDPRPGRGHPLHDPDEVDKNATQNLSKALQRFSKEDPTFRVASDPETGETIISGMGELHLDVYIERMKREYKVPVESSPPRVAYRETITKRADFSYTHKKQTGGSGQYGRVAGLASSLR
jgi:hypothetical protein